MLSTSFFSLIMVAAEGIGQGIALGLEDEARALVLVEHLILLTQSLMDRHHQQFAQRKSVMPSYTPQRCGMQADRQVSEPNSNKSASAAESDFAITLRSRGGSLSTSILSLIVPRTLSGVEAPNTYGHLRTITNTCISAQYYTFAASIKQNN